MALSCRSGFIPKNNTITFVTTPQLATNYIGHFELCRLLQQRLIASGTTHVHVVTMILDTVIVAINDQKPLSLTVHEQLLRVSFTCPLSPRDLLFSILVI
jgi:hypothetical protein